MNPLLSNPHQIKFLEVCPEIAQSDDPNDKAMWY